MKVYIAGPMSGYPQFNYPLFDRAATYLRGIGFEVTSPAEMDDPATREAALASPDGSLATWVRGTWGDFLSRDVKLVSDEVDGIVMLPGWAESRGARLELFVALQLQRPTYFLSYNPSAESGFQLFPLAEADAMQLIADCTLDQGDVSRYGE